LKLLLERARFDWRIDQMHVDERCAPRLDDYIDLVAEPTALHALYIR